MLAELQAYGALEIQLKRICQECCWRTKEVVQGMIRTHDWLALQVQSSWSLWTILVDRVVSCITQALLLSGAEFISSSKSPWSVAKYSNSSWLIRQRIFSGLTKHGLRWKKRPPFPSVAAVAAIVQVLCKYTLFMTADSCSLSIGQSWMIQR
jgi:hypothetical protein